MPYTPAYNATFAKPLVNQLIAIIQRYQASALGVVNPSLSPIAEFHKGPGTRTAVLWLVVSVHSLRFDQAATLTRHSPAQISLVHDACQCDQEMAQENS